MFLKACKGALYMGVGIALVCFLKDPLIALLSGLVIIALVEVIKQKVIRK